MSEFVDACKLLISRRFWAAFREHWGPAAVSARLDERTARWRVVTGQKPDPKLEARRAERAQAKRNVKPEPKRAR